MSSESASTVRKEGKTMTASPAVIVALCWMALLAWGLIALLRRHLRLDDQVAALDAELLVERHARAQAERALTNTQHALARLARQQENVREAERQRIGRDIHDELGQNLLALKIDLSLLHVSTTGTHPLITEKVAGMVAGMDKTISSLRAVINDLRPAALSAGLRSAIACQLAELTRMHGICHTLHCDQSAFEVAPDREREAMLFRIVQESLANVARHAHATAVEVDLQRCGAVLSLSVRDNGVGMPPELPDHGSGLAGIRERAAAIGGRLAIDSAPGKGTVLRLTFPMEQAVAIQQT